MNGFSLIAIQSLVSPLLSHPCKVFNAVLFSIYCLNSKICCCLSCPNYKFAFAIFFRYTETTMEKKQYGTLYI